jgi:uncharacterized protein YdhG (YjbR/CyaY superfamily)
MRMDISTQTKIDDYISSLSDDFKICLTNLRSTIKQIVPSAKEGFIYGVPGFKYKGKNLVCYAAFTKHCGFYPLSPAMIKLFSNELQGFQTSKGTIRFTALDPIPNDLLEKILTARVTELES